MSFGPMLLLATLEGLVMAAVLALTALGLSLVFGVMRVVNVAHGEMFMLGAVVAWGVSTAFAGHPSIGFIAALFVAPLVVGGVALLSERLVLRRLGYDPEATIVATIGLLYIIQQLALTFYGADARPVQAPFNIRVQLPWFGYSGYKLFVILAAILLMIATWFVLTRTRIGLVMRATQYDRETALAFGIPVDRVYAGVFALGAILAAVAAVLVVPIQQAHYLMGRDPLLLSFIVVIIGGLGSLRGIISTLFFSPTLAKMLATLLVAMVLVFRPQGLFGTVAR
jgi:branched-chain amino acid transport system permease protein